MGWAEAKTTCRGEGSRFHFKIISPHSSSPNLNEQNFLVQQGKHQVCVHEPILNFTIWARALSWRDLPQGHVGRGRGVTGSSRAPPGLGLGLSLHGSEGASGLTLCGVQSDRLPGPSKQTVTLEGSDRHCRALRARPPSTRPSGGALEGLNDDQTMTSSRKDGWLHGPKRRRVWRKWEERLLREGFQGGETFWAGKRGSGSRRCSGGGGGAVL